MPRRWAHHVKVSVFCKPEDKYEEVKATLVKLFPLDLGEERIKIDETKAQGFNEREIRILDVFLKKENHTQAFLKNLMTQLSPEQKLFVRRNLQLTDDFDLHLDLDKNRLQNGVYWLTTGGSTYHVRIRAAAFPAKRGAALETLTEMLEYSSVRDA